MYSLEDVIKKEGGIVRGEGGLCPGGGVCPGGGGSGPGGGNCPGGGMSGYQNNMARAVTSKRKFDRITL